MNVEQRRDWFDGLRMRAATFLPQERDFQLGLIDALERRCEADDTAYLFTVWPLRVLQFTIWAYDQAVNGGTDGT